MTVLRFLWPYLLGAAVLGGGYLWADFSWCNHACSVQKKDAFKLHEQFAELDRQRIAQQERWAQQTAAEESRAKQQESDRAKRFQGKADVAKADGTLRGIAITDPARRMLGDAYAAATTAGAAGEPKEAAPADSKTVADTTAWGIAMLEWANVCKDRVSEWESFYNGLRSK